MDATAERHIIRPVGSAAQFNTSRHSLGLNTSVIVTCRYNVAKTYLQQQQREKKDDFSFKTAIEDALAEVIMRHPLLRVGIADEESTAPKFVHLREIDLRRMIEWRETIGSSHERDLLLLRSIERCHEPLWEALSQKPGWKLVVHYDPSQLQVEDTSSEDSESVIGFDMSFCFHHAYADGKSAYIFHRDLLRALNSTGDRPEDDKIPKLQNHILHLSSVPANLPPPLEELVPFQISWTYLFGMIWSEIIYKSFVPSFLKRAPPPGSTPWTGRPISFSPASATSSSFALKGHLRLLTVPQPSLKRILTLCRAHSTTLTGLLQVLVLKSIVARLGRDEVGEENVPAFRAETPISLAPFATPGKGGFDKDNTIHCLVTAHAYDFDSETVRRFRSLSQPTAPASLSAEAADLIWEVSRDFTASLRAKVGSLPRDDATALAGYVSDWRADWLKKVGQRREFSWEISNVGSLSATSAAGVGNGSDLAAEKKPWSIDRAIFSQCAQPVGAAFEVNVAGVEASSTRVTITVGWGEGVVDGKVMEGLVTDLDTSLTEIVRWVA